MGNFYNYSKGVGNVGSYQISGIPYATSSVTVAAAGSSPTEISFPYVTKFVTISNTNTGTNVPLRFGFSALGVTGSVNAGGADGNNYYFILDNGDSYTGEFRITSLYLLSDTAATETSASIVAGLTGIATKELPGPNWSGSVGVG
tara:strand:- start:194 stop:628 length:435 start_codon:yes stop_codon:yes gene_type:complete